MTFCPPERREIITASDAPIILGVSPHHDATWLYAYKLGLVEDKDSEAKALGRRLEGVILDMLAERYGVELTAPPFPWRPGGAPPSFQHKRLPWMYATPDGVTRADGKKVHDFGRESDQFGVVVEAKLAMWVSAVDFKGGPPLHFLAQCQHQMEVCDVDRALLGCLISGGTRTGLVLKTCEMRRNASFVERMVAAEAEFHARVMGKLGPPVVAGSDKDSTIAALRALYPVADARYVALPPGAAFGWSELERIRKEKQALEREEKAWRIKFSAALGSAALGVLPDGRAIHRKIVRNRKTGKTHAKMRLFRRGDSL